MAESSPQFDTFKDAYCAAHGCAPDAYDRSVFRRCLYRHALFFARPVWWWNRYFFQPDFEVIAAIGRASTEDELRVLIDEFENLRNVERDLLHATLRIRISTTRLTETFQELLPLLKPATPSPVTGRAVPVASDRDAGDSSVLLVRRLKRIHAEVVSGKPLDKAAVLAGLELSEIPGLLARHKEGRPELGWLEEYLAQMEQVAKLREENARLIQMATELTHKLLATSKDK